MYISMLIMTNIVISLWYYKIDMICFRYEIAYG
jgi:hypothetical protein